MHAGQQAPPACTLDSLNVCYKPKTQIQEAASALRIATDLSTKDLCNSGHGESKATGLHGVSIVLNQRFEAVLLDRNSVNSWLHAVGLECAIKLDSEKPRYTCLWFQYTQKPILVLIIWNICSMTNGIFKVFLAFSLPYRKKQDCGSTRHNRTIDSNGFTFSEF